MATLGRGTIFSQCEPHESHGAEKTFAKRSHGEAPGTPLSFIPGRAGRGAVRLPGPNLVGLGGIYDGWGRENGWGAPSAQQRGVFRATAARASPSTPGASRATRRAAWKREKREVRTSWAVRRLPESALVPPGSFKAVAGGCARPLGSAEPCLTRSPPVAPDSRAPRLDDARRPPLRPGTREPRHPAARSAGTWRRVGVAAGARPVWSESTPRTWGRRDASLAPGPCGARRREDQEAGSAWACLGLFRAGLLPSVAAQIRGDFEILREPWSQAPGRRRLEARATCSPRPRLSPECPWGSFLGSGTRDHQPDQGSSAETPEQVKCAPRKGGVDARYSALILQLCECSFQIIKLVAVLIKSHTVQR
ncbi:uncharacterized protein LOC111187078 [Delphinapterus leucas]|uniref:Uncharacterized protein LOC111187078 n=1 Tax=Delphinapterus leucas TaxID=9749 RepID=A0A2Y9QF38_DELLE|nr:uncharacterized protein LOC111187078 [Delphinapterus leucas]